MKLNVFTIRDNQVNAFSQPFFSPTNGSALRAFADHVNEAGTPANKHPQDFALYHLGTYDDTTGRFENNEVPQLLGQATEYKEKQP